MRRTAVVSLALLLLSSCVSPTPFKIADSDGGNGYSAQRLEENRYRISFAGNSVTPRQTVETYLMYLAGQITLQDGYDYFVVAAKDADKSVNYQSDTFGFGGFFSPRHGFFGADDSTTYTRSINKFETAAEIQLYKGPKPRDLPQAYDAHDVVNQLGPRIVRDPTQPGPYS